jgi:hypothetical protein
VLQLDAAGVVWAAVVEAREHPLALLEIEFTVCSNDSAHESGLTHPW